MSVLINILITSLILFLLLSIFAVVVRRAEKKGQSFGCCMGGKLNKDCLTCPLSNENDVNRKQNDKRSKKKEYERETT